MVVEEVGERPVADVVEQAGHPQRLDDQALGRDGLAGARPGSRAKARVERARPQARLVHDPEAVGEARVLGRREDPARALELADPAQPLEPGGVEQVLLGDVLVGQPGRRGLVAGQALGQLDVAVDRVADQVDRARTGGASRGHPVVARGGPPVRGGHVVAQCRRLEHLDVVAPRQDPEADLDRARTPSPARCSEPSASVSTVWVGCQVVSRTRSATAGVKRSTTSTGGWSAMMSQAAPQRGRRRRRHRAARTSAASAAASPIRSILNVRSAAALLVEADQVERVRLERRLEEVRPDGRPARRGAALVAGRLVVEGDDPALRPGLGQQPDVAR